MAFNLSLEPCLPFTQPLLNLPLNQVLEHKAGVGVNPKCVDVAGTGVVTPKPQLKLPVLKQYAVMGLWGLCVLGKA